MSPINEVLEGLKLQSIVFSRMTLFGAWGFAKYELRGAPFHLLLSGSACLQIGDDAPQQMGPGDIAILPRGEAHLLLSKPDAEPIPFRQIMQSMGWTHWTPGMHFKSVDLTIGTGEPTATLISGVFVSGSTP